MHSPPPTSTVRIEYIDALRGFTMILVVLAHVAGFGLNADCYSSLFTTFHMPLFFFISGFVFYKANRQWNLSLVWDFVKRKVSVQILSPFLFFCLFAICQHWDIIHGLLDEYKYGYWFTWALFEFFVIYLLIDCIFQFCHIRGLLKDILMLLIGLAFFLLMQYSLVGYNPVTLALGCGRWMFFLFFVLGTLTRKFFTYFEWLLDKTPMVSICICAFILLNVFPYIENISIRLNKLCLALSGIVLTFAAFRHYQVAFSQTHWIGRALQFVGRRTLDIYLLHYFFVYSGIASVFVNWNLKDAPFVGFIIALVLTICVIALCLAISQILRISPSLAHFLFGAKK